MSHDLEGSNNFLSVECVAYRLNVSERYIRKLIYMGRLEAVRSGKNWQIPISAFEEFVLSLIGQCDGSKQDQNELIFE